MANLQYCVVGVLLIILCEPLKNVESFTLTVLHTNDVHARFDQMNKYSSPCSESDAKENKCFGGSARLKTKIQEMRNSHPNTILLDAGDQYQGTIWFFKYQGNITATFMNKLGYEVMAIGNHEFDYGPDGLKTLLDMANFPVVSCNTNASMEPSIHGKFKKHTVLDVGGEKVGVVGYTTRETTIISNPGKTTFLDEVASIQAEVDNLTSIGINKIIALGHSGFEVDLKIAKEVRGVDIVVGGHTNTFLYTGTAPSNEKPVGTYPTVINQTDGSKVLCVQDYAFGKYLGFLQVEFDDNGKVYNWTGNPILLNANVTQDPGILADLEPYRQGVVEFTKTVVGRTHVELNGERLSCRRGECNLGNLIADAMVKQNIKHSDSLEWNHVAMAIMNSGGIRASVGRGPITAEQVMSVQPFQNTVDIVELLGETLLEVLEFSASLYKPNRLMGGFLQFSGLRVTYNVSQPEGRRVVSAFVTCTNCSYPRYVPLDKQAVYEILIPSFVANGGDGYTMIRDKKLALHRIGDLDSDILIEYIKGETPITQGVENRIIFVNGTDWAGMCNPKPCSCQRKCDVNAASALEPISPLLKSLLLLCLFMLCNLTKCE